MQLGKHYIWRVQSIFDDSVAELEYAHSDKRCRILRVATVEDGDGNWADGRHWWIVFPDGYITLSHATELINPEE